MKQLYTFDTKTPDVGKKVFIAPGAVLVGDVTVGDESSIWFNAVIRGDIGSIKIGKKVNVQDGAVIHTMDGKECVIGDGVTIGHNVTIHAKSIGDNCLIGMGSNIMGNTEIGEFCIIGANTFLPQHKKIPPYSLVYGNPAKIVRRLREDEIEAVQGAASGHAALADYYMECLED